MHAYKHLNIKHIHTPHARTQHTIAHHTRAHTIYIFTHAPFFHDDVMHMQYFHICINDNDKYGHLIFSLILIHIGCARACTHTHTHTHTQTHATICVILRYLTIQLCNTLISLLVSPLVYLDLKTRS